MPAFIEACFSCGVEKATLLMKVQTMHGRDVYVCHECLRTKRFPEQKKGRKGNIVRHRRSS